MVLTVKFQKRIGLFWACAPELITKRATPMITSLHMSFLQQAMEAAIYCFKRRSRFTALSKLRASSRPMGAVNRAEARSVPRKSAPDTVAPVRSAPLRSAPRNEAPERLDFLSDANCSSARDR